jgi:hypothetical protein
MVSLNFPVRIGYRKVFRAKSLKSTGFTAYKTDVCAMIMNCSSEDQDERQCWAPPLFLISRVHNYEYDLQVSQVMGLYAVFYRLPSDVC